MTNQIRLLMRTTNKLFRWCIIACHGSITEKSHFARFAQFQIKNYPRTERRTWPALAYFFLSQEKHTDCTYTMCPCGVFYQKI